MQPRNKETKRFIQPAFMIVELEDDGLSHPASFHKKCCKRYKDGIQKKCKSCPKRKKKG